MREAWLLRHAETAWSRDRRHTGRTDVPLTAAGREAAASLRGTLEGRTFSLVLTSPLARARETCALAGLGEHAEVRDDLLEWDYGDYEGVTTAEIRRERPGWYLWRDGCPGGESPADVAARADTIVEELAGAEGDVAVFAHGHVLRMLAARWIAMAPEGGGRLALSTASISVLGFEREVRVIARWNQ